MMAQDWHIDGKGRFAFPKRAKGKFAGKKAKPDTDKDGGDKRGMLDGDGGEMGMRPKGKGKKAAC